jgi:UDP-3-O-[3-hydroxymyristoyl] N-acetylglucosamine deacetylase/3-hydroxyacyl-[acyl-carrier-protein] dehydratase
MRPAAVDEGIVFHLQTELGAVDIPVTSETTGAGLHRTVAATGGEEIQTIEHLLAALAGLWIDNVHLDLTAPEPPGAGGSAQEFCQLIQAAGIVDQEVEVAPFELTETITVVDGRGGMISAMPHKEGLKLGYVVHYQESKLAQGMAEFEITPEVFAQEIAPCRTFCLESQAKAMQAAGCGQGANTDNTVVLREHDVVDNELRFDDECARHKVLDMLGDLSVLGRPLAMHIVAVKGGHELNAKLVEALIRQMQKQAHPKGILDINDIEATLPHRYPFLLVDRILELDEGKRIVGLKNVTRNEEFFNGHFPGQPVMPGVLQIEALAQTGGIMLLHNAAKGKKLLAVLMSIDGIKYRKPVVPGDQLVMTVEAEKIKGRIGQRSPYQVCAGRRRKLYLGIFTTIGTEPIMSDSLIHPTAIIEPGATLAENVTVGPYAYIGSQVTLGEGCELQHHATVTGNTTMGRENIVHPNAVVGGVPQDLKYADENTVCMIGDRNVFRECCTVNTGTVGGGGKTVIGSDCLLMAYSHVAHDCVLGNRIIIANSVQLAGHIIIDDGAIVSGMAAVHHFASIGRLAFVGGMAGVRTDVPPFTMVEGVPARVRGLNLVGLKRAGLTPETVGALKKAYRKLFRGEANRVDAVDEILASELGEVAEVVELVEHLKRSMNGKQGRALEAERDNNNGYGARNRSECSIQE